MSQGRNLVVILLASELLDMSIAFATATIPNLRARYSSSSLAFSLHGEFLDSFHQKFPLSCSTLMMLAGPKWTNFDQSQRNIATSAQQLTAGHFRRTTATRSMTFMSGFGFKTKKDTFKYTGTQRPGVLSPTRKVPDTVVKPDYWADGKPKAKGPVLPWVIHVNSPEEIAGIRAGRQPAPVYTLHCSAR